jgi:hypothetical protein
MDLVIEARAHPRQHEPQREDERRRDDADREPAPAPLEITKTYQPRHAVSSRPVASSPVYSGRSSARIADYGFKDKTLGHYEEDHLIPLAVGGSPRSPKNLWPEKYAGKWGARVKDKLERFLHDRVCDGTVRLSKARKAFRDWKAAFKRFEL